ncbi:DNA polymerase epsilon catalytic subunit B [Nymphaea thermarum]|nr:DNA polymerase epsilon catalytic subunit B [Nymphaea thermarum]
MKKAGIPRLPVDGAGTVECLPVVLLAEDGNGGGGTSQREKGPRGPLGPYSVSGNGREGCPRRSQSKRERKQRGPTPACRCDPSRRTSSGGVAGHRTASRACWWPPAAVWLSPTVRLVNDETRGNQAGRFCVRRWAFAATCGCRTAPTGPPATALVGSIGAATSPSAWPWQWGSGVADCSLTAGLDRGLRIEVFDKFLHGSTLEECYAAVSSVANRWLDLLDVNISVIQGIVQLQWKPVMQL